MTKDEVIALARKAQQYAEWVTPQGLEWFDTYNEKFAALVEEHLKSQGYRQCAKGQRTTQFCGMLEEAVKAEREACAKVCEGHIGGALQSSEWWIGFKEAMGQCAAAIRSRE